LSSLGKVNESNGANLARSKLQESRFREIQKVQDFSAGWKND
jgi:hypothetical protein